MSTCDHPGVDRVFSSLAAQRRRLVLDYLLDAEAGRASFDELVDHVVEADTRSPSPDREAIATSLHHTHLPKLADGGLIHYDSERGSIETTGAIGLAEPVLEFARRREREPEA